jgi:hypothetical protein
MPHERAIGLSQFLVAVEASGHDASGGDQIERRHHLPELLPEVVAGDKEVRRQATAADESRIPR